METYLRDLLLNTASQGTLQAILDDEEYYYPRVWSMDYLSDIYNYEILKAIDDAKRGGDYREIDFNTSADYFFRDDENRLYSIGEEDLREYFSDQLDDNLPMNLNDVIYVYERNKDVIEQEIYNLFIEWMQENGPEDWGY